MKKFVFTYVLWFVSLTMMAQVPAGFNYQAVVRNSSGEIVANQTVKFRISILQNSGVGTAVYVETHSVPTGNFGLANFVVGLGNRLSGSLDPAGWGNNPHFLKVELDPANGDSFSHLGTIQLLAVPYAFHAKTVEIEKDDDPTNEIQVLSLSGMALSLSRDGGTVTLPSAEGDNWGSEYVHADATLAGQGTPSSPLKMARQSATTGQVLKWNGTTWVPATDETGSGGSNPTGPAGGDLSGTYPNPTIGVGKVTEEKIADNAVTSAKIAGNAVTSAKLAENSVTEAKIANGAVSMAKIAQAGATAGQVLHWSGSAWQPGDISSGSSLWQQSGDHVYYSSGNVGIGTSTPGRLLDIVSSSHATLRLDGSYDAAIYLHRGSTGNASAIGFYDSGSPSFWAGMLKTNSFRITTDAEKLIGLEVTTIGNVNIRPDDYYHSILHLKAPIDRDALIYLNKGSSSRYAATAYKLDGTSLFYSGLFPGNSYRVSTDAVLLKGIEVTLAGNFNVSGPQTNNNSLNLNKGIASGVALWVNNKEALWFNGTYFSWGYGGTANYFKSKIFVGAAYTTPTQMLDVSGNARIRAIGSGAYAGPVNRTSDGTLTTATSDLRLKGDVQTLQNSLDKLMQLRGVSFTWKGDPGMGTRIGFIAQEFEKIFPELVFTNEVDGYKGINYAEVTAVLVEAVKEQQHIIDELKAENDRLKAEGGELNSRLERLEKFLSLSSE